MDEERTAIVVEIKSEEYGLRRVHITTPESLDSNMTGDADYLQSIVRDLRYLIIDELRRNICADTGIHPDDDVDVKDDFKVKTWWFD